MMGTSTRFDLKVVSLERSEGTAGAVARAASGASARTVAGASGAAGRLDSSGHQPGTAPVRQDLVDAVSLQEDGSQSPARSTSESQAVDDEQAESIPGRSDASAQAEEEAPSIGRHDAANTFELLVDPATGTLDPLALALARCRAGALQLSPA